jgi:hypothetical protein
VFELDIEIAFCKKLVPKAILGIAYGFYFVPFEEIGFVIEKSFPHEHGNAVLRKDQSV